MHTSMVIIIIITIIIIMINNHNIITTIISSSPFKELALCLAPLPECLQQDVLGFDVAMTDLPVVGFRV